MKCFKTHGATSQFLRSFSLSSLFFLALGAMSCAVVAQPKVALPDPLSSRMIRISGHLPLAVKVPASVKTPVQARPFFDYFSWESFIALNWPLDASRGRGMPRSPDDPEVFWQAENQTPVVWSDYKEAFELFGQKNIRPSPWNSYQIVFTPCDTSPSGQKRKQRHLYNVAMSAETPELDTLKQAFSYPLIDQQGNLVYYEVLFNRAQYSFVRGPDHNPDTWLYLADNLVRREPIHMPDSRQGTMQKPGKVGAIMLKAAWKQMTARDDLSRYYVMEAQIFDPETKQCSAQKMGLIGFHMAQKLENFPQWIWSTFEQVDNVPGDFGGTRPYSLNNGTNQPRTIGGFANRPPEQIPALAKDASGHYSPAQVTRLNPIPNTPDGASTQDLNRLYQQALQGTVWKHYQLVVTQWPSNPSRFTYLEKGGIYPQDAGEAFPVNGAVNTSIETYFQSQDDAIGGGGNSCMSCHYQADQADFSWVLQNRAHAGNDATKR